MKIANNIYELLCYAIMVWAFVLIESCNPDDEPEFKAAVAGKIVDNISNEGIPSVEVSFRKGADDNKSVLTNELGVYSFEETVLLEEKFIISASKKGYEDSTKNIILTSGDLTDEMNFVLKRKAKVAGNILNKETERRLSGVQLVLKKTTSEEIVSTIESNDLGYYEFDNLDKGTYILSASKNGFETLSKEINLKKSQQLSLNFSVVPLPSELELSALSFDFGANEVSKSLEVNNLGGDTIIWNIVENIPWASINPQSGETIAEPSQITITIDRNGFNPGSYTQNFTFNSNAGSHEVTLSMTINGAILQIVPSELSFGTSSSEESIQVERIGQGTLTYDIQSDKTWLSVTPTSGTVSNETDFVIVSVDRSALGFGNHEARLAFNADNDSHIVNVSLTVPDPNAPQLTVDPLRLDLGQDVSSRLIDISNTGKGSLNWNVSKSTSWLSVSSSEGTLAESGNDNLRITINRSSLTPGAYDDVLRFSSNGGSVNVPVAIEVANSPVLGVSTEELDFGRNEINKSFEIKNVGNGSMSWSVDSNQDWISLNPKSGTNSGTVNVSVSRDDLSYGNFSGQIDIESDGGVDAIAVKMRVSAPNQPPIADFSISSEIVNVGQEISLDASSSSDPEDALSLLAVRWRFTSSGAFSDWTNVKQVSTSYPSQGIKTITLEVKDTEGDISSLQKDVNVIVNQPPNAVFTVSPNSGKAGQTVFNVNATGSNDDIDLVDDLQYRWRWDVGQSFSGWSRSETASYTYGEPGTKEITLEVLDSYGAVGSVAKTVEVSQDLVEIEPNDVYTSASVLPIEREIFGSIDGTSDDQDWFEISITENGRLIFTIVNTGNGENASLDEVLIYDQSFNVRENISDDYHYNPSIGPSNTFSSGVITVSEGQKFYVLVKPDNDSQSTSYILSNSFDKIDVADFGEPNNASDVATLLEFEESINATVGFSSDDEDWYRVTPNSNGKLRFTVENLQGTSINGALDKAIMYNDDITYLTEASDDYYYNPSIGVGRSFTSPSVTVSSGSAIYIKVQADNATSSSYYRLKPVLEKLDQSDVGEPNNSSDVATSLNAGEAVHALVGFGNDNKDWYSITANKAGSLLLTIENLQTGSINGALNKAIVYSSDLTYLAEASDGYYYDPSIGVGETFVSEPVTVTEGEIYFVSVEPNGSLDATNYRILVEFE